MKTLLILVDGMRSDSFTDIPSAQRILSKSAYTLNARTVIPSITLPCHMSLFHSTDPSRHGITSNVYIPMANPINGLFEVLSRSGKKCSAFYGWEELRDISRPGSLLFTYYCAGRHIGREAMNNNITDAAIDYLKNYENDFAFLYLGYTDWAGHNFGWMSDGYLTAIKNSWNNIERIIDTLSDDYSIIITADHGGHDRSHGTEMPEDMTIPIIMLGNGVPDDISLEGASIKDIAPTIVSLLEVEPDPEWEGHSLI
nr:alkaline phosphatase family protein [Clostridia bacterium]